MHIATKVTMILPDVLFVSLHSTVVLITAHLATALIDHDLIAAILIRVLGRVTVHRIPFALQVLSLPLQRADVRTAFDRCELKP